MVYWYRIIGEIGLKHLEFLPEIVPALVDVLKDDTPAVARQAISCGIDIFRCSLVKVAIQVCLDIEYFNTQSPYVFLLWHQHGHIYNLET